MEVDGYDPNTPDEYKPIIQQASLKYGVPTSILSSLLSQESGFNPRAQSPAGAVGIAQFMPSTAKAYGVNPLDPLSAIDGAARYLYENYKEFKTWDKALAAYNAGPGAVRKYDGVPPYRETQNYVQSILKNKVPLAKVNTQTSQPVTPQPTQPNRMLSSMVKPVYASEMPQPARAQLPMKTTLPLQYNQGQYTVQAGDTLWGIAQRYLGSGSRYQELGFKGSPTQLPIGTKLTIPTQQPVPTQRQITTYLPAKPKPQAVSTTLPQTRTSSLLRSFA